jgi:hypothetical protein
MGCGGTSSFWYRAVSKICHDAQDESSRSLIVNWSMDHNYHAQNAAIIPSLQSIRTPDSTELSA